MKPKASAANVTKAKPGSKPLEARLGLEAQIALRYRAMIEETDHDRMLEKALWRDHLETADFDNLIDVVKQRELAEDIEGYKKWRAAQERIARQRREYARATKPREAMIDAWLDNDRNMDIVMRVPQMVRDADSDDVIDLLQYREELATTKKKRQDRRDRLGIL